MNNYLFIYNDGAISGLGNALLADNVIPALRLLQQAGFSLVEINTGPRNEADQLASILQSQGIHVSESVVSQDSLASSVAAVLAPVLARIQISTDNSFLVHNSASTPAGEVISMGGLLGITVVDIAGATKPGWLALADTLVHRDRTATSQRHTNETHIQVELNLDRENKQIDVSTGMGFFDHMLEQIAKHGGFAMNLQCDGDLHIDEHHTVEDCALALGETLRQALGDKRGIGRYGFLLPMDESEVQVSMDLSARPSFHFSGQFSRDKVGDLSTELVPHFFKSLSDTLGASLHITMTGENAHHQVEATFKAVGRALGQAIKREGTDLPTTKGMI